MSGLARISAVRTTALAYVLFIALATVFPAPAYASEGSSRAPGASMADAFVGEVLNYRIGFWFFDNVASGRVSFRKGEGDGEYIAMLEAHTTGLAGWLTRRRRDKYVSHLVLSSDGTRFITRSFEKTSTMRGKTRHGLKVVDYEKRTVISRSWGGGKDEKKTVEAIPEGVYTDDPLCAFYNFRSGVYGPVEEGREYRILTFPKDGRIPDIYLRIATNDEKGERAGGSSRAAFLAHARIDKEIFGSQTGDIEILFSMALRPVYAVAKDILFFGDIRGTLVE